MTSPVTVQLNIQGASPQAGVFGRACIAAVFEPSIFGTDKSRIYNSVQALSEDFPVGHPVYELGAPVLSQNQAPDGLMVLRISGDNDHEAVFTATDATEGRVYTVHINDLTFSHVAGPSDDEEDIVTAISSSMTGSVGLATDLNWSVVSSSLFVGANLTNDRVTKYFDFGYSNLQYEDQSDYTLVGSWAGQLNEALVTEPAFSALCIQSQNSSDILDVAAWAETSSKLFFGMSKDSDIPTSATDDVASDLNDLGYKFSSIFHSKRSGKVAAAALSVLGLPPGEPTWAFKQFRGLRNNPWSNNEEVLMASKSVNYIKSLRGINYLTDGKNVDGSFIDVTRDLEWFKDRVETEILRSKLNNSKIPFNENGMEVIRAALFQAIDASIDAGVFNEGVSVLMPQFATIPDADKIARKLNNVVINAQLQGAIQSTSIVANITF